MTVHVTVPPAKRNDQTNNNKNNNNNNKHRGSANDIILTISLDFCAPSSAPRMFPYNLICVSGVCENNQNKTQDSFSFSLFSHYPEIYWNDFIRENFPKPSRISKNSGNF